MRRRWLVLLVCTGIFAASVVVAPSWGGTGASTDPASTRDAADEREGKTGLRAPVDWLALGDSYSSGEGVAGQWGECARSRRAYAFVARRTLATKNQNWADSKLVFRACTGARAGGNLPADLPAQLDSVAGHRYDLITLSIGGNDARFSDIVKDCLGITTGNIFVDRRCSRSEAELNKLVDAIEPAVISAYVRMRRDYLKPGGQIVVLGYPWLFEPAKEWASVINQRCRFIDYQDADMLRRVGQHLNTVLRHIAAPRRIHFIDVQPGFDGHNLCASERGQEWINGIVTPPRRYLSSFHPTAVGHAWEGARLAKLLGTLTYPSEPLRISRRTPSCDSRVDDPQSSRSTRVKVTQGDVSCVTAEKVISTFLTKFPPSARTRAGNPPHVTGPWYCSRAAADNWAIHCIADLKSSPKMIEATWLDKAGRPEQSRDPYCQKSRPRC